ncbi:MAG TPA: efflux RND transporter periplasmic adaptor subunit [Archangium sp.]|jgi:RND family efflux transporter MFP subunit|uniref:efflux RND transporter periplasmic adaptor subunit n=1 Tax=Archangium sp. TaxID=1872627 RepID=UPI002ED90760
MGSRALLGGLGLVLLVLVGTMAALRQRTAQEPGREAPRVEQPRNSAPRVEGTPAGWLGLIISEEALDVAARVDGRVESVKVQVGSEVRQGDVLVKLDSRSLQENLAMAEAELLSSKAELEVALASLEQARERLARRETPEQLRLQVISEEELSAARYEQRMASAKGEVARAKVQEQEVRVGQLRQQVTESSLRAPFDGVVAGRLVNAGAVVRAGQPLLHLLRRGKPQVRFAIPVQDMRSVAVGHPVQVAVTGRDLTLNGQVRQVAPEVDVATLMVFALADVELPEGALVPAGTVVRVKAPANLARTEGP